ncbi:MAG: hypothetical protein COB85_07090 [Bacteroidetes bacterium]|nr:MAG: hypothetical protein COB85_07090 [Bacteroidota bacterium]
MYTYNWSTTPSQSNATVTGLSSGNYYATVTDGLGCDSVVAIGIAEPSALLANALLSEVSCNGGGDGSITLIVSGGVPSYTYLWDDLSSQTAITATGLSVGSFTATVTDVNGCTVIASAIITEPSSLTVNVVGSDVSCNGACDGVANAFVSGGTAAYTYAWNTAPAQSNASATGLCPGTYTVNIVDANGCNTSDGVVITEPPLLTSSISSVNHVTCNGGTDGNATVGSSGGTQPYTYLWNDLSGQTDSIAVNFSAGTYLVTVTDANGCDVFNEVLIVEPQLLTASVALSGIISCKGADDGQATVSTTGGTPAYTYLWNDVSAQTTSTADGLTPGNYIVTITDLYGCITTSSIGITEPDLLTAAIGDSSNVSCFGGSNGSATVTVVGGTAAYTFLWNDISAQSNATASGLSVGNYVVTITDANGCDTLTNVYISEPSLLTHTITSVVDVRCNGDCDGTATVAASGGTPGYSYVWNTTPFQSNATATGLCPGEYIITVIDANGCVTSDTVTIIEPKVLVISLDPIVFHVKCKGGSNGEATVTVTGGSTPYTYAWDDPFTQTTATATGLSAGPYIALVTDSNNCGSTGNVTVTIFEPSQFLAVGITDSSAVSCSGGSDGTATALASGGTPFYTYSWSTVPVQNSSAATGLSAGLYTVIVSDANGCDTSISVNIDEPTLVVALIASSTSVTCQSGSDGTVTASASGGTTPYSFSWSTSPAQTTSIATGLMAGTYTVTVTDSNNCASSSAVIITAPDSVLISTTSVDANCGNSDGAASVAVTGGVLPYSYLWSPGGETTDSISSISSGVYSVDVMDANGCVGAGTAVVLINDIAVFIIQDSIEEVDCFGGSSGTSTVSIVSGTPPFTLAWSHDSLLTDSTATGLYAGVYYLTVTDSNGCLKTEQIIIAGPDPILDSVNFEDVTCFGDSNGEATVYASGGTPPFTYSWSTIPAQTDTVATGLSADTYNVTITDAQGCDTVAAIPISSPDSMIATITSVTNTGCNGACDGTATVVGSGGTAPYGYSWNTAPIKTDPVATGLCPGSYTITLMDSEGCLAMADTIITQPDTLSLTITNVINISCNGYVDGQATATASGGTPGYDYLWTSVTPVQTDSIATGLQPITHTVFVTDTNGCTASVSVSITEPSVFTVISGAVTHVSCPGGNDGTALALPSGGTPPYFYSWNTVPVQSDSMAVGLGAGTVTAVVTDTNGCTDSVVFVVNEPASFTAVISDSTNVSCFGGSDGEVTVTAGGGAGIYTYLWSDPDSQVTATATGLSAGNYNVLVTDNNGCSIIVNTSIIEPSELIATITDSADVSCNDGNNGSALVSASGGTFPYVYLWDDDSAQTTDSAVALSAGIYTVTVIDSLGCEALATHEIIEPVLLIASFSIVANVNCAGDSTGSATVTASGGTPPFTYLWNDPTSQTDSTALNLSADTFNVMVTDFMGCDTLVSVIITEPDSLFITFSSVTDINCYGYSTGEITANVTGGIAPYTYTWNISDTSQQTNSTVTGLPAGSYTLTIIDGGGCAHMDSITLSEQPEIVIAMANDTLICVGMSVPISVTANGGTGNLSYIWSGDLDTIGQGPFTVQPVDTSYYIVTVEDSLGCQAVDTFIINVSPFIIIFTLPDSICEGDSTTIGVTVLGGDGDYSYYWSNTGDTTAMITVWPVETSYYVLSVTDGCGTPQAIDSVLVEVSPYPVVGIFPQDISVCENATIGFIDLIANPEGSTYYWDFGDGTVDTTTNPFITHVYDNVGIFNLSVSVISANGCQTDSSDVGTIFISPLPTADFSAATIDSAILQPTVAFTDLSFGDPFMGDSISTWYWDFGDGTNSIEQHPVHVYNDTGTYIVMLAITNEFGCPDTIYITLVTCSDQPTSGTVIVISAIPGVSCSANPNVVDIANATVNFSASESITYNWDFGDSDTSSIRNPTHIYQDTGLYNAVLTITDQYKCMNTCSLTVIVEPNYDIKVPNAFTPNPNGPNGGGYDINIFNNDVFFPIVDYVDDFHMMVFNRWGELVFESFDVKIGWDGYYKGRLSQADAYVWKIWVRFFDGKEVNLLGDVTLIR